MPKLKHVQTKCVLLNVPKKKISTLSVVGNEGTIAEHFYENSRY